jgi:elongation factor G
MEHDIQKVRNIGISAHIDSGKTTLTERVLFYTKRIHTIHDVKGKDGVQSQSITVDMQMKRYKIPCIAFVNKCDRSGSNPFRVIDQLKEKLGHNTIAMQIPIGIEADFTGENLFAEAMEKREELIDAASMYSDELTEAVLEEKEITEDLIIDAVRKGTLTREMTPVFIGSAYKNKGIQPLLDAVINLLPCPRDVENEALDMDRDETPVIMDSDPAKPVVALAFKLEDGQYGQLTYIRVYQGTLGKGSSVINIRNGKKIKIGRLVQMHADQMEDIEAIPAGYIGALFGIDCISGDTFVAPGLNLSMTSMFVPNPVISLAISPKNNDARINMSKALGRFTKEDPTFRTYVDDETFNYTHKKQTGGAGQYGRVAGYMEPVADEEFVFENKIVGGKIPSQFIASCEKGFRQCLAKGPKMGFPVTGVKIVINDGASHSVDSSEMAFQAAARGAFLEGYARARAVIHEPIMKVVVETPTEFQGSVMGLLNQRRGMIISCQDEGTICAIEAQVPLAEMFGFSTVLRSSTQGKAQFTMEQQKKRRMQHKY